VTQGPWLRALGLASVHVDSTPGPVLPVAMCRDATHARAIAETQAERARAARSSAAPDRWLTASLPPDRPAGADQPAGEGLDRAGAPDFGPVDPAPGDLGPAAGGGERRPVARPAEDVLPDER
jgi:hypothetical protein